MLGEFYASGTAVSVDYVQSYKWFNLAASLGNDIAAKRRDTVASMMTPMQITEAQRQSTAWTAE
jgi:TPR repeat protein